MSFKLLSTLTETVRENTEYETLVENTINDFFGEEAASTVAECAFVWAAAKDSTKKLDETGGAASQNRSAELDFVNTMRGDQEVSDRRLGLKSNAAPEKGQMVMMQGGIGQIVDVDTQDNQVIVRNKQGQEKVFPFTQLAGKEVNGKQTWALKS